MKNYKIKYYLILGLLQGLAHLPLCALYCISNCMYLIMHYFIHYREKVIISNLERVFPEKTVEERKKIQKKYYRFLCDVIVEIIKTLHISKEELNRRIQVVNPELFDNMAKEGKNVFVMLGHYGNWEWAQLIYEHVTTINIFTQIYRPVRDAAINDIMQKIRAQFIGINIAQDNAFRTIFKLNKEGTPFVASFISDQRPNTPIMKYWTKFLGQDSAFVTGAEEIGKRVNASYLYVDIERPSRGHYIMTCKQIVPLSTEEEHPYTLSYLRLMEQTILRQPELWLWSHRRWLYNREEYAKHIEEFHEHLRRCTKQEQLQKEQQNK